ARRWALHRRALRALPEGRRARAPAVLPVHQQVLRARVLRGVHGAEVERGPGSGAQRALGRRVHEDGLEHAAGVARALLRRAHERLGAPTRGAPRRIAARVVKALRILRGSLFTILGIAIRVAGLGGLSAIAARD